MLINFIFKIAPFVNGFPCLNTLLPFYVYLKFHSYYLFYCFLSNNKCILFKIQNYKIFQINPLRDSFPIFSLSIVFIYLILDSATLVLIFSCPILFYYLSSFFSCNYSVFCFKKRSKVKPLFALKH